MAQSPPGSSNRAGVAAALSALNLQFSGIQAGCFQLFWAPPYRMSHGLFFSNWIAECSGNMPFNFPQWNHWGALWEPIKNVSQNRPAEDQGSWDICSPMSIPGCLGVTFGAVNPLIFLAVQGSGPKFSCGQRTPCGEETQLPLALTDTESW